MNLSIHIFYIKYRCIGISVGHISSTNGGVKGQCTDSVLKLHNSIYQKFANTRQANGNSGSNKTVATKSQSVLNCTSPVGNVVNEVLFEHEAPLFDNVKQGTLHATAINPHPPVEHMYWLQTLHLVIDFLIPTI